MAYCSGIWNCLAPPDQQVAAAWRSCTDEYLGRFASSSVGTVVHATHGCNTTPDCGCASLYGAPIDNYPNGRGQTTCDNRNQAKAGVDEGCFRDWPNCECWTGSAYCEHPSGEKYGWCCVLHEDTSTGHQNLWSDVSSQSYCFCTNSINRIYPTGNPDAVIKDKWWTTQHECGERGACCRDSYFDGNCLDGRFRWDCNAPFDEWHPGKTCEEVSCKAACCLPDLTCEYLTRKRCESRFGQFQHGLECQQANCRPGVCCVCGECRLDLLDPQDCTDKGGSWVANAHTCSIADCENKDEPCLEVGCIADEYKDEYRAARDERYLWPAADEGEFIPITDQQSGTPISYDVSARCVNRIGMIDVFHSGTLGFDGHFCNDRTSTERSTTRCPVDFDGEGFGRLNCSYKRACF